MENLLESVNGEIRSYHIFSKQVAVGSEDGNYRISLGRFRELAADIEYNACDEYDCVADDMVVLFEDGSWLSASFEATMSDTDAEQQWQYHMPPVSRKMETISNIKPVLNSDGANNGCTADITNNSNCCSLPVVVAYKGKTYSKDTGTVIKPRPRTTGSGRMI